VSFTDYSGPTVFGYETDGLRRVAFISVHTSPLAVLGHKDAGGMNVYVRELAYHLGQLGLAVDIYTRRTDPHSNEVTYLAKDVRVINITAGPTEPVDKHQLFQHLPEFARQAALFSVRDGVRYDIVHAHYWLSGWTAHLLRRYWDAPMVQMFHTTAHMKNAVLPQADREPAQRARYERMLVDLSDAVIAANPDERADLLWRQRTPSDKICTIPPGVDLDLFRPSDQAAARIDLGLDLDRRIVLFVGRIDPIKGADALIRTMARLRDQMVEPPLFVFVGGDLDGAGQPVGPLKEIQAEAERTGVLADCRFFGSRPQYDLPGFYAASDVVFVPSR
jgi:D-inositol-3-phosphate glycosyltransferase